MLNIEFIIYGNINQTSGGYYYDRQLIQALKNCGHQVKISRATEEKTDTEETNMYIIDELCHPDFFKKKHFKRLKDNVPIVGMIHHLMADEKASLFSTKRHLFMERRFLKSLDFAIFNSKSTENSARNKGRYTGLSKIAVPGRNAANYIRKQNRDSGSLTLLFLGNLIQRKGIHHVLSALSELPQIPFTFTIVGDAAVEPGYTQKLKRLIKRYKLENRVTLTGFVTDDVKKKFLEKADLMLMPSSHEGYGIAYIEAMGHGLIPIAGTAGGAGEIIRHGENGFLVTPGKRTELMQILTRVYENPHWKKQLSSNALKSWQNHPLWKESFQPLITALEELLINKTTIHLNNSP